MKRILLFLLIPMLFLSFNVKAQDGSNQVSYSNLALQFSSFNFNGDAATGYLPSVASLNGYGSYAENPAGVALIEDSYMSFGLFNNQVEYESSYLGNSVLTEDNNTRLGNLGFVYTLPTEQGSFALGGGYNRLINSTGVYRIRGRNSESTITDDFREPSSDYYDIAFETYAIDWGDVDSTYLESIFRIGFENYPGITQDAEIKHSTNIGEYSIFFGTEFQKNLFFGVSAGLISGTYSYRRNFLELDDQNDYDANFIPSDTDGEFTDIDRILTHDEIDANIRGLSLRSGIIYEVSPNLNVGVSYLLPTTLVVREKYYSYIKTELDDGSTPFQADFASNGNYEYRIKKPGQLSAGISVHDLANFSFSVSGELINYSNLGLDLTTGNNLSYDDDVVIRTEQDLLTDFMADNYNKVINLKTSLGYSFDEYVDLKAGYAYLPSKSKVYEADRNVISAGVSARVFESIIFDLNGQYSFWDDRSELYSYYDYADDVARSEVTSQQVSTLKIMAGIRILF